MELAAYYPYRSAEARETCLAYIESAAARDWPVCSEERMVKTFYGETFVRVSGPEGAQPLVLLHGAAATSLMWAPNIAALSAKCRTFAVDQMGEFGRSVCRRPLESLDDQMAWLRELADGLELPRAAVMGISYGGGLAAQFALRYPQRVSHAILIAPAATVLPIRGWFMARLSLAAISRDRFLPSLVRWMFADMLRKDPRWIEETVELLKLNMCSMTRKKVVMPLVLTDEQWRGLQVPALLLVGEHETIYSARKAVERMKRVAPLVKSVIVPQAGHDLTFAQAEMLSQQVLEFLR